MISTNGNDRYIEGGYVIRKEPVGIVNLQKSFANLDGDLPKAGGAQLR